MGTKSLGVARRKKDDEFYTKYKDIDKELSHYSSFFTNKTIYCNCDNEKSNFYKYFQDHFYDFRLKKLICTSIDNIRIIRDHENIVCDIKGGGSYDSPQCLEYLDKCDIVITNPPFSKMNHYLMTLIQHNKDFLVMSNLNALGYKKLFPYIRNEKIKVGYSKNTHHFDSPKGDKIISNICWLTTLPVEKEKLKTDYTIDSKEYLTFDNFSDIINIDKVKEIPMNYKGFMGVPISFLTQINYDQYKIVGIFHGEKENLEMYDYGTPRINGQAKYYRVIIKERE